MSHQAKKKFKSKYGQTKGGQINQRKRYLEVIKKCSDYTIDNYVKE